MSRRPKALLDFRLALGCRRSRKTFVRRFRMDGLVSNHVQHACIYIESKVNDLDWLHNSRIAKIDNSWKECVGTYLAADTIFMDCVIFWMFFTDFKRIEMAFNVAIPRVCCWHAKPLVRMAELVRAAGWIHDWNWANTTRKKSTIFPLLRSFCCVELRNSQSKWVSSQIQSERTLFGTLITPIIHSNTGVALISTDHLILFFFRTPHLPFSQTMFNLYKMNWCLNVCKRLKGNFVSPPSTKWKLLHENVCDSKKNSFQIKSIM